MSFDSSLKTCQRFCSLAADFTCGTEGRWRGGEKSITLVIERWQEGRCKGGGEEKLNTPALHPQQNCEGTAPNACPTFGSFY